jgi:two-component system phosphate regulon sensor histidine kinase PhoR
MHLETARDLMAALSLPALLISATARIEAASPAARELFGDVVGRNVVAAIRQPEFLTALEDALKGSNPVRRTVVLPRPAGGDVRTIADLCPISTGPAWRGVLATFTDVTASEQVEQIRRDFVANVSHELRTPLTALLGFIETLQGSASDDAAARARFLDIMSREANRMTRLIDDLLSLSRVQATEAQRPADTVDLVPIVTSAVNTLRQQAEVAGMRVTVDTGGAPATVAGDADQLQQVVENLMENAMKYASEGGLAEIRVDRVDYAPALRGPAVAISVTDRGPGIAPEHIPRLTERFYRADAHRSRDRGGTGLGLAIVKHILNRHRGSLRIESELGKGSRFTVLLPPL